MRVAAVIGVRDEAELIGPLIKHLSGIGVTRFVVCDVASSDGTRAILERHQSPDFQVLDVARDESQDGWRQRTADTIRGLEADWVLPIDADEFPLPAGGDIRPLLARAGCDVLRLPRYNVVVGQDGLHMPLPCDAASYDSIDLFAAAPAGFREKLKQDQSLAWIRTVPKPKIAVRPGVVMSVTDAVHDIVPFAGSALRRKTSSGIIIAHVALSSYLRFARKVKNIREVFSLDQGALDPVFGWHWRRWVELADRGKLEAEFENSRLGADEIASLRAAGTIRSAAEMLAGG